MYVFTTRALDFVYTTVGRVKFVYFFRISPVKLKFSMLRYFTLRYGCWMIIKIIKNQVLTKSNRNTGTWELPGIVDLYTYSSFANVAKVNCHRLLYKFQFCQFAIVIIHKSGPKPERIFSTPQKCSHIERTATESKDDGKTSCFYLGKKFLF